MKKLINIILIIIIIFCLYNLVVRILDYNVAKNTYDNLQAYNPIKHNSDKKDFVEVEVKKREKELIDINGDYNLWIKVEGTNIDYPVVQGTDNLYYLSHDFKKNKSRSGCIFIDYRNDLIKDKNLILYGHNMRDNTMFQELEKFKDKAFFEKNKYILIKKGFKENKYEIFSICIFNNKDDYLKTLFKNNYEYTDYLKKIKKQSLNYEYIHVNYKDKIITLSTCDYDFRGARLVIYGKLLMSD